MIRVWKFVVTVLDEDYDFARGRLQSRLGDDADYEIETWPGEGQAEQIAALEAVIAEAPHGVTCETFDSRIFRHRRVCTCWKSASPSDALERAKREAAAAALEEAAGKVYDEWPGGTGHEGLGVQWAEDWLSDRADAIRAEGEEK